MSGTPDDGPVIPKKSRQRSPRRPPAQFYLPEEMERAIAAIAEETGQNKSEVARRLLDWALKHYHGSE